MNKFANFVKKISKRKALVKDLDKDLGKIAILTETAIKNRTPVVTGRLKGSITARKNDFLDYEVATNVIYARAVEYGNGFAPRAMFRRGARDIAKRGTSLLRRSNKYLD